MNPLWLLLLLGAAEAAVVVSKLHRRPSANLALLQAGNYEKYKRNKERYNNHRISIDAVGSGGLGDYQDTEYYGNITVGSNDQPFLVILDTGTANMFVPDTKCGECKGKHLFNPSKSTTFNGTDQSFTIKYETEKAYGNYGIDTVKLGGVGEQQLVIQKQKFGVADHIPVTIEDGHADGVVGLAFPSIATDKVTPPLFNAINQGVMDQPLFTVYMENRSPFYDETLEMTGPGGQITYGGVDKVNCGPVIAYQPLSSATQYQFTIDGVGFGGYMNKVKYQAISDTSYMYIAGPKAILKAIEKEAGGWDFSCWKAPVDPLDIYIGGNKYSLQPINYMSQVYLDWMKEGKGDCQMNFMPIESNGFGPQWIFGVPFIRQFCNIYDIGQQQIGFAESLQYKTQAAQNTYVLNFILDATSSDSAIYTEEKYMVDDIASIFALGVGEHKTRFTIGGMATGYIFGGNATKKNDVDPAIDVIAKSGFHGQGAGQLDFGTSLEQFAMDDYSDYAEHEAPPFAILVPTKPLGGGPITGGIDALKKKGFRLLAIDASSDGSLTKQLGDLLGENNVCATQLTQQAATKCNQWLMHRVFEME